MMQIKTVFRCYTQVEYTGIKPLLALAALVSFSPVSDKHPFLVTALIKENIHIFRKQIINDLLKKIIFLSNRI